MPAYVRSILDPEFVAELILDDFGIEVTAAELVRSLVNDVYRVETAANGSYAFKVYRSTTSVRGWSLDEVCWEQDLVGHLSRSGLNVAPVRPGRDGELVGQVDAPDGRRPYVLSEWIDGNKPSPPWTDALYRDFGSLVARFHQATTSFVTPCPRRPFDLGSTLDQPLAELLDRLADGSKDQELVAMLGARASRQLNQLTPQGMTWGIAHGDVTLDNVHLTNAGMALHDFDSSAPGWLAADLTGVRATDHWAAFLDGYTEYRQLSTVDLAALPALSIVGLISNLRFHLVDKPATRGVESIAEGWAERELTSLRQIASTAGSRIFDRR